MISRAAIALGCIGVLSLSGCAGVRQQDVDAWVNQPVIELERPPFLVSIPLVKTKLSDGSEIWNYVNGRNISGCSGSLGGASFGGYTSYQNYNAFMSCVGGFAACNNIFYVRSGRVERYTPVGTGGARCYTNENIQPGQTAPMNVR